jgi:hypothetical protein
MVGIYIVGISIALELHAISCSNIWLLLASMLFSGVGWFVVGYTVNDNHLLKNKKE